MWFLQTNHVRLGASISHENTDLYPQAVTEYDWQELWRSIIGLLDFLSNKLDSLVTTGGVERLAQEVSWLAEQFKLV